MNPPQGASPFAEHRDGRADGNGGRSLRPRWWPAAVVLLVGLQVGSFLGSGSALAQPAPAGGDSRHGAFFTQEELEPLIAALQAAGFNRQRIEGVFYDSRLRKLDQVVTYNALNPDSAALYAQFTTPYAILLARRFQRRHGAGLAEVEKRYGVPGGIITGILLVETQFGQAKLPYRVLDVFTTLAVEADPLAISRQYDRLKSDNPEIEKDWLALRLVNKAEFAFQELVAFLALHREDLESLFSVRGSYAGAIGIPQFLPTSYLRWAVDGNEDGRIDLNQLLDAMASVANYLRAHGWTEDAPFRDKWRALWAYNHSEHYVRTVLEISFRLSSPPRKARRTSVTREAPQPPPLAQQPNDP